MLMATTISVCLPDQQHKMMCSILDLTVIIPGYIGHQHLCIGLWVRIKPHQLSGAGQLLKGKEGFVHSHKPIRNTFVVNVAALSDQTVYATTIWYQ